MCIAFEWNYIFMIHQDLVICNLVYSKIYLKNITKI